jgi:hypothetical protein
VAEMLEKEQKLQNTYYTYFCHVRIPHDFYNLYYIILKKIIIHYIQKRESFSLYIK